MLIGALSACHMLWFLNLASDVWLIAKTYEERADATEEILASGVSRVLETTVCPEITLQNRSDLDVADQLQEKVHHLCLIAWSFNFPVRYAAKYRFA